MSRFVLPVFCVGWLGVFYLAETAVRLTRVKHNHADGHANYCGFGAHIATFFAVFGVAYSSLLQGTFQLVACVQLPDRLVLFLNATVECFQPWQMAVLGIVAPVFAMWPAFLAWFVFHVRRKKRRAEKKPSVAEEAVLMVIASPYDTSRRISQRWEAVLMLQRLVFVVISMFLIDSLWRAWTLVAILLPMLVAQMLVRPFKRQPCNVLMATCLSSLIGIGAWEVGLSVFSEYGLTSEHVQEFSTILMFLTLIPLIAGVCLYLHAPLLRLWSALGLRSRRKTDDGSTLLHAAQDVEGVELAQTWDPEITEADADDSVVC
eukprot:CAMPEP_0175983108 /NCGR_PEP_ID=MMETSP0108-20121206/48271_1 /TAXON_ID=195067 ORGANISM="Goniomonas pacifica, Strain CCMP1869" /NCGR_SAMPLE_ID=MMETSP0108 /ASSEMBLY_ACC=CAM_ASM_000204 /LENGTH=317 /DNA_ID=CAMNT_0017313839 /DNA_START=50 /DNA_END=1003 /DNA_ORIENTATION=+